MFKIEKEHKIGIITGLITSILFAYFLQPILEWVSDVVVKILTITSTAFLDRIYAQAAHLQTQDFSFLWIVLVSGLAASAILTVGIIRLIGINNFRALARLATIREPNEKMSAMYRFFSGLLLIGISLFTVVAISANYIQLSTISSFQQHMRVIAPYISESEQRMIYSRWSLMKSHSDYESIYAVIRAKAQEHNLQLPENKIYTPTTL